MERCVTFMPFNVLEGFDDLPRKSERLKELRPLGFTPVSYTHLDVYKRQVLDSKLFIAAKQPSNIGIEPFRQSIRLV